MIGQIPLEPVVRVTVELVLLSLGFWLVVFRLGVARHLKKLEFAPVAALTFLMVTWLAVQLADRTGLFYPQERSYYPLARFAMYDMGIPTETVPSYHLEARYGENVTARIDPAEWLPSVEPTSLDNRIIAAASALRSDDPRERRRGELEIAAYAEGIRALLELADEPVPDAVLLHAIRYRVRDRALVADSVVWSTRW